jgi:phosphoglycolate phosphatase
VSTRRNRLILFDIDGTLLNAGRAGRRAIGDAMTATYGTTGAITGFSMAGRTDPEIVHELLGAVGFPPERIEAGLEALWSRYVRGLEAEVESGEILPLPGVAELVDQVEERGDGVVLGLLTGNIEPGARLKLDAAGIGFARFRVGAYGSDHWRRSELPAVAVARARERTGIAFAGREIVIVGDTPFDIACGAHLGVRTVAVATGRHSADELAACGPDTVLPDLTDPDAFWEAVEPD